MKHVFGAGSNASGFVGWRIRDEGAVHKLAFATDEMFVPGIIIAGDEKVG